MLDAGSFQTGRQGVEYWDRTGYLLNSVGFKQCRLSVLTQSIFRCPLIKGTTGNSLVPNYYMVYSCLQEADCCGTRGSRQ